MNKKQKKMLIRIIIAAVLLVGFHYLPFQGPIRFFLYLIPYLVIGYDILIKAWKGIRNKQPFDENLLMAIATIGAMAIAVYEDGDYTEAIAVMLFYQVGEWFQSYAVGKSRRNISELMDIRPDYANIEVDGKLEQVDPDEVEIGSVIVVQPGEKIPIDGIVVEGTSSLNTSALTGESLPREVNAGDEIISGCINMTGVLKIQTSREFGESTVSKILDGKCQFQKVQIGKLYHQICPCVYTGRGLQRHCAGRPAAACAHDWHGAACRLGDMDLSGADLPCHQLSMCACHQYPPQLFRRNRRRQQCRNSGEGIQLSGKPFSGKMYCL